ncbi:MAG: PadR family transcriptional regulator [Fimbriimonas sp.]|nr:PadR family transcriptional regulator [Fimbriimonas sp.]
MKLSISEYTILGLVWAKGPCTTYTIMREMAASPTTFYRNRAATTYRTVHRLESAGLVAPVDGTVGARQDRLIRISEAGALSLESWLTPPLSNVEVAHTIDLVRLRMYFIGALPAQKRTELVDDALLRLKDRLRVVETTAERERENDPYAYLATLGAVLETQARIRWLEAVRENLSATVHRATEQ